MGIGFDFGPPKAKGFDPIDGDWLGSRKLSTDELSELVRLVESWGYALSGHDGEYLIDVPCEEFMFNASGGYLSKPGAGSERDRDDEFEEQLGLAQRLCDYAGWVMVGDGYGYGFEKTDAGYEFHTSPPERAPDVGHAKTGRTT